MPPPPPPPPNALSCQLNILGGIKPSTTPYIFSHKDTQLTSWYLCPCLMEKMEFPFAQDSIGLPQDRTQAFLQAFPTSNRILCVHAICPHSCFLSVAGTNIMAQSNLAKKRVYLAYTCSSQSTKEGGQDRKSSRNLKQKL